MRIKRLELLGFKSFVEPTVIDFDAPITGVVGPNGCGKSNVVDAIRWVMGEMSAKSLRGRAMEDVIFNGSEKRPPLGMGEVSLTFSTEDGIIPADYAGFTEITVTRRLYRSGESEYLINKVPCRLRDVVDLFLGTGVGHKAYSIIEQGKIDFVINAKPEERRLLLEEAAGVSKFKARKEAALRKIEGTEQNLARLKDILHEVIRQINALDRQVKKAARYKELKNELRDLELKLAAIDHREFSREITELKTLLDDWSRKETASSGELSLLETDIERGRLEMTEKDTAIGSVQEKAFEVASRLKLLEAQHGFKTKENISLQEQKETTLAEITALKGRLESLGHQKEEQEKSRALLEGESGGSPSVLDQAEKEFGEVESRRTSLVQQIERLKESRLQEGASLHQWAAEKRVGEERQVSRKAALAKSHVERDETARRLEELKILSEGKKRLLEEASEHHRTLQAEAARLRGDLDSKRENREILSRELDCRQEGLVLKRSRFKSLIELEKNFEGYEEGVRSVLQKKREEPTGIFGVVADVLETPSRYEMAVSAALGEKLQYVIVQSHEEGIEAINYLKEQSTGRSSFIPMEVREPDAESFLYEQKGVVGPLLGLVAIKEEYRRIGQYLLNDFVLVESLGDALSIWKANGHRKTLVTLEGEVVDPFGVVSGGITGVRGKLLLEKKREIKELREVITEMEGEISLKEDSLSQLEGSLSELSMETESIARRLHEEEMRKMAFEREWQQAEADRLQLSSRHDEMASSSAALEEEISKGEAALAELEQRQTERAGQIEACERQIRLMEEDLIRVTEAARTAQAALTQIRVQEAAGAERRLMEVKEWERILKTEEETRLQIDQKLAAITDLHQKMNLIHKSIEETQQETLALQKMFEELTGVQEVVKKEHETLAASLREKESRIREVRKGSDLAKSHTGDLRVTLSRVETEQNHLVQQTLEKYSVDLPAAEESLLGEESLKGFNVEDGKARAATIKEKLEQMGDVNLGAIPEYEELKVRRDFLAQQIEDLEKSLEALKKAIARINQTTKKRFEAAFELVNERFQTLFPRLFQGGRAEIRFSESAETGISGVDLLVQPPGKKLAHIGLLSGGEKALAAIAFVFSIFLVKPSPFCILDEVDAPLDDVNTERFHRLLSELVSRTQFILITHNRRTMEKAELLYGVTMQEPGVSQLVSVRLNDVIKMAS